MAQYDGSIRINTGITTKQAEKELKSLESSVSKTAEKIASLRSKMDALKDAKIPTAEYKNLQREIESTEKKLLSLYDRQERFLETGGKESSPAYQKMIYDAETLEKKLQYAEQAMQNLVDSGKAFTIGGDTKKYAQMSAEMQQLNQQMESDTQRQSELQSALAAEEQRLADIKANATVLDQHILDLLERRKQLIQEIADLEKVGVGLGYQEYENAVKELSQINNEIKDYQKNLSELPNKFSNMANSAQKAFGAASVKDSRGKDLLSIFSKKTASELSGEGESAKKTAQEMSGLEKSKSKTTTANRMLGKESDSTAKKISNEGSKAKILQLTFGNLKKVMSSIFSPAKKAFEAISGGANKSGGILSTFTSRLKGIALSLLIFNWISKAFNSMISGMKKGFENFMGYSDSYAQSVQSMKNAMSTLGNQFAAAFSPIVQMVIPWITELINAISNAISYVSQFFAVLGGKNTFTKATQIQDKYNKSLGGTAAAAKKAAGALASFDTIEVLNKKNDGAAGAGGGAGVESPSEMFEEVPVEDKWKNIADQFKKMWENSDFYDLGKLLGENLKDMLDNIPWEDIKESARRIGKSIASSINGFIEVDGLGYSIGKTLAEAFNTGFEFLNAFVHELHWDSLGKFIAKTLNGIFENIDWDLIYDTFTTLAKGLGDAINSLSDNLNWEAISEAVSNIVNTFIDTLYIFVTTVDWKEFGEKVGKTISDAWAGIDWKKAGETLGEYFKAFFDFISGAIESIDWWMVGESVKNFLIGIDWAGVAESFFEAVGAAIGGLAAFIGGLIGDSVIEAKEYFSEKIEESGGNIVAGIFKGILDAMLGANQWVFEHVSLPLIEGISEGFSNETWDSARELISVKWEEIKTIISEKVNEIIESVFQWFSDLPEKIGYAIGFVVGKLIEWKDNVKTFFDTELPLIIEGVVTWFKDLPQKIYDAIIGFLDKIREWKDSSVAEFQTNVPLIINEIVAKFKELPGKLIEIGKNAVEGLWNGVKEAANGLKDKISGFCTGFVNGFKDALGVHSPSTIFAEIGGFLIEGLANGVSSAIDLVTDIVGGVVDKILGMFNFDKFSEAGQGMVDSIISVIGTFRETWDESFSEWMESNQELFFGYDVWYELFSNILTAYMDMFTEFSAQWQADMDMWWTTMVMPFFEFAKWQAFGTQMKTGIMNGLKVIINEIGGLLNKIISMFDSAFKQLEESMNDLIDSYNSSAGTLGTSRLSHVHYSKMGGVKIPALASGAVIRGGNPFMAILGDQPRGQINVETPAGLIKDMVVQGIAESGIGNTGSGIVPVNINLNYNGETFARLSIPDILGELNRQGYDITALMGNG